MRLTFSNFAVLGAALAVNLEGSLVVNALGAYFCNDINWQTDCAHWTKLVANKCYTLDAQHQNALSSFGPDVGTTCILFDDYLCQEDWGAPWLSNPGSGDLRTVGYTPQAGVFITVNDKVNSFSCFAT
ncbi:hypothetical protein B0H19DRAFT_1376417 [Mycena capillaripes]|nr:hypothetical protein B0H19DRAFT_1376417 [Mycena capillaripes]